jgi:bifunctional non-homologous end joining protein LigD
MLARSGPLPREDGYALELKWDGFRAIVRCGREFGVRSRRGWNMTALLPELAAMPVDAVLDGELAAPGQDGWPDFPLVCDRLLNGKETIPLIYVVFDLLELDGKPTTHLPYRERRPLLESLGLHGPHWQTSAVFDDGEAVFTVAQERGLEGVVAKRLRGSYRPGERGWVKIKNREYWRYALERESAIKRAARAAVPA